MGNINLNETTKLNSFITETIFDLVQNYKVYVVFCQVNENAPLIHGDLHPYSNGQVHYANVRYGSVFEPNNGFKCMPRMVLIPINRTGKIDLLHYAYCIAHERGHVITYNKVNFKDGWLDSEHNEDLALQSGIEYLLDNLPKKLVIKILECQNNIYKKRMNHYSGLCALNDKLKELQ